MVREEFVINGWAFTTMDGFYDEVERVFTCGLTWRIGRNLNAFNDVLRGGFGRHEPGVPILVRWLGFAKSERNVGPDMMAAIEEILCAGDDSGHNCVLVKQ